MNFILKSRLLLKISAVRHARSNYRTTSTWWDWTAAVSNVTRSEVGTTACYLAVQKSLGVVTSATLWFEVETIFITLGSDKFWRLEWPKSWNVSRSGVELLLTFEMARPGIQTLLALNMRSLVLAYCLFVILPGLSWTTDWYLAMGHGLQVNYC
jgi:hypothetical protein